MKTRVLSLLAVCLFFGTSTAFAKIWRVNNNPGITANFPTLQAAHDGAGSGDTLHLEGSPTSYGGLTAAKKLVIIGPGYYLDQNPSTQALTITAKVGSINLQRGAAGSVIMGLDFETSSISVFASDIVIRRNKFMQIWNSDPDGYSGMIYLYYDSNSSSIPISNIIISQNYGGIISNSNAATGILITNNFIHGGPARGSNATILNLHTGTVALVQNNIFGGGTVTAYNSSFTNNIMVAGTFTGTGNLVANNIGNETQFGTVNGNKSNVSMANVFVGAGTGVSNDGKWKLKTGSPAIGAGYGSTAQNPVDAGMFGGKTPYVLSGLPPVPAIYFFENQPVGSSTDPIKVTIKVKAVN